MKLFHSTKKKVAVLATAAAVVASTGIATAYWTSDGSGAGSATVGDAVDWQVDTTPDPDATTTNALSPDGPTQTVGIGVTNNGSGVQRLGTLTVSVAESNGDPWTDGDCSAADFSVGSELAGASHVITADDDIAAGGSNNTYTVTVQMVDTGANQDDCKTATVPLYVVAS